MELLEPRMMLTASWQNACNALDVSGDGYVVPLDALLPINQINTNGAGPLPTPGQDKSPPPFYDVNGDNFISPIDVLLVINLLNNLPSGPMFSLGLARDTAPQGSINQDKITSDDRIAGKILTPTGVISLRARVDGGEWFDVVPVCGSFEFQPGLATSGGDDGTHRIEMTALDPWHRVWQDSMQFVLDTQPPALSLALNPDDDTLPSGDGITEKWNAGLVGTTEPGLAVNILPDGAQASADASGKFSVANLPLATGTNSFEASAYDAAGNLATTATSIERTFCFDPPLSGWTASESGGSDSGRGGVTASSCQAVLREGDSFQVALTTDFVVPSVPASVQFSYHDLKFDASASGAMRDAFEVAVVDASGVPLVPTFQANRDAFLSAVEELPLAYPSGVQLGGSQVTIGLAGVPAGTAAKIVFRLLGNDQDHDSSVWIDDFSLVVGAQPAGPTPSDSTVALSRQNVDFSALSDVSASIRPTYRRTSLQAASARVHAELQLQNSGQYAVDGPLYVAVANLSDPSVGLSGYDGLMPDGIPYLEVPLVGSADALAPGEASGSRDLAFYNPQGVAFTYNLKVLGHLNRGPTITSLPVNEAVVGRAFQYSVKAEDAESDPLVFTLVSGPSAAVLDSATGNLTWIPTSADVGSHAVEIRVADSRGGVISQAFTLSVVDSLPNRPPIITSRPVTDASVVTSFDVCDVAVGRDPVAIAVGDFDGTGTLSLVTADPGDQVISLAAGNGSGSYAPATSTSVGEPAVLYRTFRDGITLPVSFPYPLRTSAIYGIAKGDFDGDGFLDLAGTAINDIPYVGTVGWILTWHGNGDGTFQDPVYIDLPRNPHVTPYGILSRDFDRDGDLDLIVAAGTSTEQGLWLLRGNGDGTFEAPTKVVAGTPGGIVQTADLNGDGKLDLVSGGGTQVQVYLGDGTGAFTTGSAYTVGNGVIDLAIGDLDGDGKPDLAVASYGNATMAMLLNDGTGSFVDLQFLTGIQPTGVMIADFNGNGRGEIALSTVSGTFRLVERQDDGTYRMLIDDSAYGQVMSYTFSQRGAATDNSPMDVNGDGKPDVVFNANWEAREIALVGVNKGDGTFTMTRYVGSIGSGTPGLQRSSSISKGALFGDFNNDGVSDLVVASENEYHPGSVNIHLGTTPGKIDAPTITDRTPVSGHTSSNLVTGDFTGDGLPDAIQVGGSLAVFPNQGDGTLGRAFPGTGYISGSGEFFSNHARVADFNADGILDVVYSAGDGVQAGPPPRYIVSLGLGNGTFQPTVFYNPGYHAAQNIIVADFNRDGLPDIAGWIQDYAHIEIWLNDPSNPGHFRLLSNPDGSPIAPSIGPLTAYPANGFTAADFTGDGIVDLVAHVVGINADNPERQYVFPGNGDGTFATPFVSHPGYYESNEMVAADLNRDGKQDLVSIVNGAGSYIQLGNGDGTFAPPSRYAEANGNSVAVSDVNRDGVSDIVSVSSYYTQDPAVLIGRGDGTFDPAERYAAAVPSANTSISVTDLNQDGAADIVYFDGYLALVTTMYGNGPGLSDVATADINGDGRRDVVAVNTRNDRVKLLLGNGDNTFSRSQDLFTGASPVAVAVADLNGDGRAEIVTANATGTVTLFVNQGDGKFQSTNLKVGKRPTAITLADVTGDGSADIVVANGDGASVSLLAGDGAGNFAAAQAIPVGIHPSTVSALDVTGDGVRDLVLGSAQDEAFVILRGLGSGAFQAGVPVPTQASFSDLVVGDVTGDGTPDLVVANPTEQQVSLYAGLGNGKFQTPQPVRIDHAPVALALRDLNSDGREDIVAANRDSNSATIISSRPTESQPYAYHVTAADPDGDSVTYALVNAPGGMSIDPASGNIAWSPTASQLGRHEVIVSASDGRGGAATQTYAVTVALGANEHAPRIVTEPIDEALANQPYQYAVRAADPDGDPLRYRLVAAPDGMTIDANTGTLDWGAAMGRGLHFNGRGDVATVPESPTLDATGGFSVALWARFDALPSTSQEGMALFRLAGANGINLTLMATTDGSFQLRMHGGNYGTSSRIVQTDRWYHLAMTFDPIGHSLRLYSNGQLLIDTGLAGQEANWPKGISSLMIGNDNADGRYSMFFNGEMDELRAYDRPLTAQEALGEYHGDRPASPPGLIGWWDLNERDGVVLWDRSGKRNDGTLDDPSVVARMRIALPDRPQGPGITGDFPVVVRVEDGRGGFDEQQSTLHVGGEQPASVSGTLFNDSNGDGARQADEPPLSDWSVYVDRNQNGILEDWEPSVTTFSDGAYHFAGLVHGSYALAAVGKAGWRPTLAQSDIALAAGQDAVGINLGQTTAGVTAGERGPTFLSIAPQAASVGQRWQYQPAVKNPDGRKLAFDLVLGPEGMAVHPDIGALAWIPTASQSGLNRILLRVRDDRGLVDIQEFNVDVAGAPSAPVITSSPLLHAWAGVPYHYQLRAQDADNASLTFGLVAAPAGMSLDSSTGMLSWTPEANQLGNSQAIVRVIDSTGLIDEQAFTLTVEQPVTDYAPTITSMPRTVAALGTQYLYQARSTDVDGDQVVWSLAGAPVGMSVDALTGLVTWTPSAEQLGDQAVSLRADDGRGASDVQAFTISVRSQPTNQPPQFTSVPLNAAAVDTLFAYDAAASDPDFDPVQYRLDQAPSGMSIDLATGTVRWRPASDLRGEFPVTIRATDPLGGEAVQSFAVAVGSADAPPVITSTPPTLAGTDRAYQYQVAAADPFERSLTYTLTSAPAGMTIDSATGEVNWTPHGIQPGSYPVAIRVANALGGAASQAFDVALTDSGPLHPPVITSTPPEVATQDTLFRYQVTATTDQGLAPRFELRSAPADMTLDPINGLLEWTPTAANIGTTRVTLAVIDPSGAVGLQSFLLTVLPPNHAPAVASTPNRSQAAGGLYRYDLIAADADHDVLSYTLATGPAGMSIDAFGRIQWQTSTGDLGTHPVEIIISDGRGGTAIDAFDLNVVSDTVAPRVVVIPDRPGIWPWDPPIRIRVSAVDNVAVTDLQLTAGGVPLALDPQGYAVLAYTGPGQVRLVATARDAAGNVGVGRYTVRFLDPYSDNPSPSGAPQVAITSPSDQGSVSGFVTVRGTAQSDDMAEYRLSYRRADESQFTEIVHSSLTVADGVLGTWDTTLLPNDSYVLRLEATNTVGDQSVVEVTVDVAGELKLGNFRLSFVDLSLPVAGVPITVTRTYDTLQSSQQGEFGYGWTMDYRDAGLRTSLPKSGLESYGLFTPFQPGTKVYLTLPGGQRQAFTFNPEMHGLFNFVYYTPRFTADAGVNATLSVPYVGLVQKPDGAFYTLSGEPYNPASEDFGGGYTLTTADGMAYRIDGQSGKLNTVADRNGNTLTFSSAGISSSSGTNVRFERDGQGRITAMIDPAGHATRYQYDASGNLTTVVDADGNATQMIYRTDRPHFLDKIIDPLGRVGTRIEYDEQGRLKKVLDVDGNAVNVAFDPDHQVETTTDALGHATTLEYDQWGNVVTRVDAKGAVTRRTFDANHRLLSETDPLGQTRTFTYDASGRPLSRTDAQGNSTWFTYDATGQLASRTDPLGNTTRFEHDARGNTTLIRDPLGNVATFEYDAQGNLTKQIDPLAGITTYQYDAAGNRTREIDALGHETTFTYDANGRQLSQTRSVTTAAGVQTLIVSSTYDGRGNMLTQTDAAGGVTHYEYDGFGNRTATVGPLGHRVEQAFDERGYLSRVVYADGLTNALTYDELGRVVRQTGRSGFSTGLGYDAVGQLESVTLPDDTPADPTDNLHKQFESDPLGRLTAIVDQRGNRTEFAYDLATHGPTSMRNALGNQSHNTYDAAGRMVSSTDPLGRVTRYEYDALDRQTAIVYADGARETTAYDALGRVLARTDAAGKTTHYEYDKLGQLTRVIDALGGVTGYAYDELGRLISLTDARNNTTRYEYDAVGHRTAVILPLGARSETHYDLAGLVTSMTDSDGRTVVFEYDANGQLKARHYPDGSTVSVTHTATGLVEAITDARGTIQYRYDAQNRVISKAEPDGTKLTYTYDASGNLASISSPTGTTRYTYDALNRLETVTDPGGGVTRYVYDAASQLRETHFPNATLEKRDYDARGRLTGVELSGPAGVIARYRYTYDVAGQLKVAEELSGRRVEYAYDDLYRLTSERTIDPAHGTHTTTYTYDAVGNRLTKTDPSTGLTAYEYDANDQLAREVQGTNVATYRYDANGNTLSRSEANGNQVAYHWDVDGHLRAVETTDATGTHRVEYDYDALGNMVSRSADGKQTRFLVDTMGPLPQVVEEYDVAANARRGYVRGLDLISTAVGGQRQYYVQDGQSGVRGLVSAAGAVVNPTAYDAFGDPLDSTSGLGNVLYQQQWRDPASGLYYLRARHFDPQTGRFLSRDTARVEPGDLRNVNAYVYASSDPVNRFDPSGHISLQELAVGFGIVNALMLAGWFQLANAARVDEWHGNIYAGYADFFLGGVTISLTTLAREYGSNPELTDRALYLSMDIGGGFGYRIGVGIDKLLLQAPGGSAVTDMAGLLYRSGAGASVSGALEVSLGQIRMGRGQGIYYDLGLPNMVDSIGELVDVGFSLDLFAVGYSWLVDSDVGDAIDRREYGLLEWFDRKHLEFEKALRVFQGESGVWGSGAGKVWGSEDGTGGFMEW